MNTKSIAFNGLYKTLKGKRKKWAYRDMYTDYISLIAAAQFSYDTPDFNSALYEQAIYTGVAAFYKCNDKSSVNFGKWCCTPAVNSGLPDNFGISKTITTHGTDYTAEMEVDKECVLIYNNSLHTPETYFGVIADMLTETDISTAALVKWSRMSPIPKVKTDEQIAIYTEAMRRVLDGEEITTISDPSALFTDRPNSLDDNVLRLTDEQAINKMHFYSEFYEQLIRRICTLRGIPFSSTAKSSQNLTDELHDMDIFAMLYINDCYETRKECFKKCEEFSGHNFNFDYSDIMKMQIEKTKKQAEITDDTAKKPADNNGGDNDENIQS